MTIAYPLTMPATGISALTFGPNTVIGVSESPFTLQQQAQGFQGEGWAGSITVSPMTDENVARPWLAFLAALRGRWGTFYFGEPNRVTARGTALGAPVANSAGSPSINLARDRLFYTTGWTPGQSAVLKAGDYFSVGSGEETRLHMVLQDVAADSSGEAVIDCFPALRSDIPPMAAITVASPMGTFRMASNKPRWSISEGVVYAVSFDFVEAQ